MLFGKRLRAAIFDLDDTLIGWREAEAGAIDAMAREHLVPLGVPLPVCLDAYKGVMAANVANFQATGQWWFVQDRLHLLLARLGLEERIPVQTLVDTFLVEVRARLRWLDGAPEALAAARAAGLKVALLTNGFAHVQRPKIEQFQLVRHVDFVGVSAELGHWKPKPEAFQAVCRELGVPVDAALMVGDSLAFDIQPAKALGMATCWIDGAGIQHPDADLVARRPRELVAHLEALLDAA